MATSSIHPARLEILSRDPGVQYDNDGRPYTPTVIGPPPRALFREPTDEELSLFRRNGIETSGNRRRYLVKVVGGAVVQLLRRLGPKDHASTPVTCRIDLGGSSVQLEVLSEEDMGPTLPKADGGIAFPPFVPDGRKRFWVVGHVGVQSTSPEPYLAPVTQPAANKYFGFSKRSDAERCAQAYFDGGCSLERWQFESHGTDVVCCEHREMAFAPAQSYVWLAPRAEEEPEPWS